MAPSLLQDKVAIVTGGGRGIGRAICLGFAENGASVAVADNRLEAAKNVASEIKKRGGKAIPILMDVTSRKDVRRTLNLTLKSFSRLDILVNNAGIVYRERFIDHSEEAWRKLLDVNLTGCFICAQECAREMIKRGRGGRIINIASTVAVDGGALKYRAGYGSSKAGVVSLTKTLALELANHKITVNAISPGEIRTSMTASVYDDSAKTSEVLKHVPLGRIGEPEDIAGGAIFLASGLADYVTAHVLVIDGGMTAGPIPDEVAGFYDKGKA